MDHTVTSLPMGHGLYGGQPSHDPWTVRWYPEYTLPMGQLHRPTTRATARRSSHPLGPIQYTSWVTMSPHHTTTSIHANRPLRYQCAQRPRFRWAPSIPRQRKHQAAISTPSQTPSTCTPTHVSGKAGCTCLDFIPFVIRPCHYNLSWPHILFRALTT